MVTPRRSEPFLAFPGDAESGAEISSPLFLWMGYFNLLHFWSYGYTVMLQTMDTYLRRYGLDIQP